MNGIRKEKNSVWWIIIFCVFFFLPFLTYPLVKNVLNIENVENRNKADIPEISIENWKTYSKTFEEYLNDTLPYRDELIRLNSLISYYVFGDSASDDVIIGEENWLFYSETIPDYEKNNLYTDAQLQRMKHILEETQQYLADRGIEFVVFIPPNKATIYGEEYLPSYIKSGEDLSRTEQLVAYIQENTDITIIFPKQEMLMSKERHPEYSLYFHLDTHWNSMGAYVGTKELMKTFDIELPEIEELEIVQTKTPNFNWNEYDLASMMGLAGVLKNDVEYEITNYANTTVTFQQCDYNHVSSFYGFYRTTSDAPDERKVLFLRDSFGMRMVPYLAANFAEVYSPHRDYFSIEMVDAEKPDIFVWELVERSEFEDIIP